ncbi:hypothetical protein BOX15_Mlig025224g1 [Macrostomum lignano]|uniref:Rho-GAP domain-containing protein n=1 Tax=Macrostomum lignano TaxID=282301 RepID=A0A267H871_9PLAT|nr:hypothetical protein BOX15_Mlig025224g1 [Macrostomum lignano]
MADESRKQYAMNHPIRELFDRLQLNTSPFESTHPPLDTRFMSIFQRRLANRFQEIELQMQLNVKLSYCKCKDDSISRLDILSPLETMAVRRVVQKLDQTTDAAKQMEPEDPITEKFSMDDMFDLIAVGVRTSRLSAKLDEIKKVALAEINNGESSSTIYCQLAEFVCGNSAILLFTLITKKDAFVYIKGGRQSYLSHDMLALRCSTQKLVLTFLMIMEGADSAVWSDDIEYLELVSSNGLHNQTLFSKKNSYQHIIFAFGEFPVTATLLEIVERERAATGIGGSVRQRSQFSDEHSSYMLQRQRSYDTDFSGTQAASDNQDFADSSIGRFNVAKTSSVGRSQSQIRVPQSKIADPLDAFNETFAKDFNRSNIYAKTMEDLVSTMQRGLMTDRNDMPSDKRFMEVKLKTPRELTNMDAINHSSKFVRNAKAFVRVDSVDNSPYPKLETRYARHSCTQKYLSLTSAFTIVRSGRNNICFDTEAEKVLLETVMLRDVYMPRVVIDNQVVDFDRSVSFLEKAYGVVVLRNPGMLPAEWCFVPCYDTMRYGPPGMRIQPQNGIIPPGGVQLIKLKQTVNVQVLRDPSCLTQHLVIHVMTGGDYTVKPRIAYRRSCYGMPLDELVQLAQPVGRFAQADTLQQLLQQQQQQQVHQQSPNKHQGQSVQQQAQPSSQQQQQDKQQQENQQVPQQQQRQAQNPVNNAPMKATDQRQPAIGGIMDDGAGCGNSFRLSPSHALSAKYRFYALPSRTAQTSPMHRFLIPKELKILVETARRSCLKKPDLFRRGGYHRDLQEIRWLLDNVESWNAESRISSVSAYSILEAIVLFFDCLPDSLFPSQLYSTIMDASKSFKNSLEIYNCLPEINANVFVYLITFLKLVHSHSSENDTDLPLFADTFADVLIKPPAALSLSQIPKSDRDSKRKFLGYFLANDVSHLFQIDLLLTRDEYPLLARHLVRTGTN